VTAPDVALDPDGLERALRALGSERYHDRHPFHRLLLEGRLDRGQVQAWALNRFHYQAAIPRKDAAIVARATDPAWTAWMRGRAVSSAGCASPTGWASIARSSHRDAPCFPR